jgi:hypothetical protein
MERTFGIFFEFAKLVTKVNSAPPNPAPHSVLCELLVLETNVNIPVPMELIMLVSNVPYFIGSNKDIIYMISILKCTSPKLSPPTVPLYP